MRAVFRFNRVTLNEKLKLANLKQLFYWASRRHTIGRIIALLTNWCVGMQPFFLRKIRAELRHIRSWKSLTADDYKFFIVIGFALLQNMRPGQKGKSLQTKGLFASFSYYKLRAREHLVHNVFGWEARATELAVLKKSLTRRSWSTGWLVVGKPWGRSRSSWPEQACATANAMAVPWWTLWRATSLTWFGTSYRRTTGMVPLELTNPAAYSIANRRLSN